MENNIGLLQEYLIDAPVMILNLGIEDASISRCVMGLNKTLTKKVIVVEEPEVDTFIVKTNEEEKDGTRGL